jgi:hypothetical protein
MDKQLRWWWGDNAATATYGKQQSTNAQQLGKQ